MFRIKSKGEEMSDTDIHSCGYYCDRHACILRQRDELRDNLFATSEKNTQTSDTQSLWRKRQNSSDINSSQGRIRIINEPQSGGKPNYTQPKEWISLTDDEIADAFGDYMDSVDETEEEEHNWDYERLIEAKVKEKNGYLKEEK